MDSMLRWSSARPRDSGMCPLRCDGGCIRDDVGDASEVEQLVVALTGQKALENAAPRRRVFQIGLIESEYLLEDRDPRVLIDIQMAPDGRVPAQRLEGAPLVSGADQPGRDAFQSHLCRRSRPSRIHEELDRSLKREPGVRRLIVWFVRVGIDRYRVL